MKKSIISIISIVSVLISSFSVSAADVPRESATCNVTNEAIIIIECIIGDILTEVQNGLGYADARAKSNRIFFNAWLNGQTNGYSYGELVDIANAAIWQYRDMYLRPGFYTNNLEKVRAIIAPVIEDYKFGKITYAEAEFNAQTRIYQSIKPDFNPDVEYMKDPLSRDIPSIDNSLFIIDEATWERVHELRKHRRRNNATGRESIFSGLVYCADCGSKLYFCAAKSITDKQEFYRCAAYKENTGTCSIHYIRDIVLRQLVLETIQKVAEFVQGFEPVFVYLFAKKNAEGREKNIRAMKLKAEQSKKRIAELDKLIERIYTDNVMGKISDERFAIMSANFEAEQKELRENLSTLEQSIIDAETEKVDMKRFLETIRECTELKELTPAIVNTLIKRIEVHNSIVVDGVKRVPIDIHFTAVGLISLPDEKELLELIEEIKANPLKSA